MAGGSGRPAARGGAGLDAERAYVEALEASWFGDVWVDDLVTGPGGPGGPVGGHVVGPVVGPVVGLEVRHEPTVPTPRPPQPPDVPTPPMTRRERRLVERRLLERRGVEPDGGYDGPDRRVGERRTGERRAALAAERARAAAVPVAPPAPDPTAVPGQVSAQLAVAPRSQPVAHRSQPAQRVVPPTRPARRVRRAAPAPRRARRGHRARFPQRVVALVPSWLDVVRLSRPVRTAARTAVRPDAVRLDAVRLDAVRLDAVRLDAVRRTATGSRPDRLLAVLAVLAVVAGVVAAATAVAVGIVWTVSGGEEQNDAAAVPVRASSLLVGVGTADGLTAGAVLASDAGTAMSLLLPGDVMVDDGLEPRTLLGTPAGTRAPAALGAATSGRPPTVGAARAAADEVGDALGVRLDGAWILTPAGLAGLVDAAGGVRVDVDTAVSVGGARVPAGPARLTGEQAAAYATWIGPREQAEARLSRFHAVLAAVVVALPASRERLVGALAALEPETVGTASRTRVAELLLAVRDDSAAAPLPGTIVPLRQVTSGGVEIGRALDPDAAEALVGRLLPHAVAPAPAPIEVRLVDGVGLDGLTDAAVVRLRGAGLGASVSAATASGVAAPSGASGPTADAVARSPGAAATTVPASVERTTVTVPGTGDEARRTADRVVGALRVPAEAVRLGGPTGAADVLVVLGRDFADDVTLHGV